MNASMLLAWLVTTISPTSRPSARLEVRIRPRKTSHKEDRSKDLLRLVIWALSIEPGSLVESWTDTEDIFLLAHRGMERIFQVYSLYLIVGLLGVHE